MVWPDIKFSHSVIRKELSHPSLPTSRNGQCENFCCQWELALTFWFDMKISNFIPFLQDSIYTALNCAQDKEIIGKHRKSLYHTGFLPHSSWAAFLCKYHPLALVCKYYKNQPQKKKPKKPTTPKPRPLYDLDNHYRFWIEFQAMNSLILLKQVLSVLGHSSADTSKVLMSHLNR